MKNRPQPEWELLPPEEKEKRASLDPLFKWIAFIMDDFLRIPGTKFRFGLDPIIGLLPGIGDTGSAIISALAYRGGAPRHSENFARADVAQHFD